MTKKTDDEIQLTKLKNLLAYAYGADSDIYRDYCLGIDVFDRLQKVGTQVTNDEVLEVKTIDELRLLQHRIKRENAKTKSYNLYSELKKSANEKEPTNMINKLTKAGTTISN